MHIGRNGRVHSKNRLQTNASLCKGDYPLYRELQPCACISSDAVNVRQATTDEAEQLFAVQRASSVAGLAHIYPPELYPYPDDAIRARWQAFPGTILVAEHGAKILGVAGIEDEWLHGFYVLPEAWGTDVAHTLHAAAVQAGVSRLWCLEANHRARRFYEKRGWTANGETRVVEYPPHPLDIGYSRSA